MSEQGSQSPGDRQPSDAEFAQRYRRAQGARLLRCYEDATGETATDMAEVDRWAAENPDALPLDERGKIVPLFEEEEEEAPR